ncbi:hypothetical protein ACVJBD_004181 [Rhizobium mongolense]
MPAGALPIIFTQSIDVRFPMTSVAFFEMDLAHQREVTPHPPTSSDG